MDSNYSFEDADYLLKRDWFISREDIDEFLWELNEDVFQEVLANRCSYSNNVRDILMYYEPRGPICAKELTDEMMDAIWIQREDAYIEHKRKSFDPFVPPPRELTLWDSRYDTLTTVLNRHMHTYTKLNERPTFNKHKIDTLIREIQTIENELNELRERIASINKDWKELKWIETVVLASGKRIF